MKANPNSECEEVFNKWIDNMKDPKITKSLKNQIVELTKNSADKDLKE